MALFLVDEALMATMEHRLEVEVATSFMGFANTALLLEWLS